MFSLLWVCYIKGVSPLNIMGIYKRFLLDAALLLLLKQVAYKICSNSVENQKHDIYAADLYALYRKMSMLESSA